MTFNILIFKLFITMKVVTDLDEIQSESLIPYMGN